MTLGAHNIKFPYVERSEYGENSFENGDTFLKNTFGSIYNSIASTWNEGMAEKEGSAIMFEGDSDMESTVRHIMRGKSNAMELEGLAGMIIIHETTVRGSNKLRPYEKTEGDLTSYVGDHTSFDTDINGNIYKYETYEKTKTGYFNPTIRFDGGQKDGTPGAPHINKKTKQSVTTPHIQTKKETRKPTSDELPRNSRF